MDSIEIRRVFLDYFAKLDHTIVPSMSLLPKDDPTLLFTSAGMVQFKPYWSGVVEPPYPRAASSQKCLRLSDIEKVGHTTRHLSFFEMLGNFSFGDYFKREAIEWGWRFLTEVLKIDKTKLSVSVHKGDDEAYSIWKEIGLEPVRLGDEDNFWGPAGKTGACGPSSEIFYDLGKEFGCGKETCGPGCDCDRFPEVWNLVFPQYDQKEDGSRVPLKNCGIDTGMGLERLAMIMNNKKSLFTIDLFLPIINRLEEIIGTSYADYEVPFNIIVDHTRALVFAIGDGIIPSNENRGYVLRRLLRRALVYGQKMEYQKPLLHILADSVITMMGDIYPEIFEKKELISVILKGEEERFLKTLNTGLGIFDSLATKKINGKDAFILYDSYGFPIELTKELARERGIEVDIESFNTAMEERKHESRQASVFTTIDLEIIKKGKTNFVGYDNSKTPSEVIAYAIKDKEIYVALDPTPFYAESGGQIGDQGIITGDNYKIKVEDCFYYQGLIVEKGTLEGKFKPGSVIAEVDIQRRMEIMRAHTATHLLHRSLKNIVGDWIRQEGSLVEPGRLRFDFLQFSPISREQITKVEESVYQMVVNDIVVEKFYTDYNSAIKMGATALFDEKYGEDVRVVRIGDFSIELCGGLHLDRTGEIGTFKIISESGVAAGIRRIEALVGFRALNHLREQDQLLVQLRDQLGENPLNRAKQMTADIRNLNSQIKSLKKQLARYEAADLQREEINGFSFYNIKSDLDCEGMRHIADKLRKEKGSGGIIYHDSGDIVTFISPDFTEILSAVDMMKIVSKIAGGGGGGRPDLAQGGGTDIRRIKDATEAIKKYIQEKTAH